MDKYLMLMKHKIVRLENTCTPLQHINENTLVIHVLTDFRKNQPIFVRPNTSADHAYDIMKIKHVRSLFVLDEEHVIGVITSKILSDGHMLKYMTNNHLRNRADVLVYDLMIPKDAIHAIDYDVLNTKQLTIKEIIEIFCNLHERHLFVTQKLSDDEIKIIGIISAADIARGMNINLEPSIDDELTFSKLAINQ